MSAVPARPSPSRAALIGLILLAPCALFLLANVLNELGIGFLYAMIDPWISGPAQHRIFNVLSPIVFLGGIAVALAVNVLAIARVEMRSEPDRFVSTLVIERRTPNVAMILTGGLMLATLVGYTFVENFAIVATHSG
jgi:hypothetical protein